MIGSRAGFSAELKYLLEKTIENWAIKVMTQSGQHLPKPKKKTNEFMRGFDLKEQTNGVHEEKGTPTNAKDNGSGVNVMFINL